MTNDRAVEILKAIIFLLDKDTYSDGIEEAIHMAINALQAQEQLANKSLKVDKESGELISRKAAMDEIRKCRFVVDAIEKIKGLPSAQPKHDISKANFLCPICGAEMEVEVSEWEGE